MLSSTPNEVTLILAQLEPILTRWYNSGTLGSVATVFGENELKVEERPIKVAAKVTIRRTVSRAKAIGRVG